MTQPNEPEQQDETAKLLTEIRDTQRQAMERQGQLLWILVPILAVLCVQTVLALTR